MNSFRLNLWSERQQVAAVILMAGAVIFALWFFLLAPLNARRQRLERETRDMRAQLAMKNYLLGERVLQRKLTHEQQVYGQLLDEWQTALHRLSAIPETERAILARVDNIDYKVALLDVRRRLAEKSRALNIKLPHDLGMDEAVESSQDARELMLQLRAVESLVELTLDRKIRLLHRIEPLPPVLHHAQTGNKPFFEEYPVRIEFWGTLENLYDLVRESLGEERIFVVRNFRVEKAGRDARDPELLNVSAVLSALVFLADPEELLDVAQRRQQVIDFSPLGQ